MAFSPEEISQIIEEFFNAVGSRQYIGARYVPIFGRKNEISIEWDNTAPYEPLTIVLYQGNSYTSRQFVPTGVDILNQEFWANTGNYNAQIEQYRREVINIGTILPVQAFSNTNTVKDYIDAVAHERIITFDSVYEMQHSSDLRVGDVCRTLGFHVINDGGGAYYLISDTGTSNGYSIIPCDSLNAIYIFDNNLNLKQFGAYCDNVNDDTDAFAFSIAYLTNLIEAYSFDVSLSADLNIETSFKLYLSGCVTISESVSINPNIELVGDGAVIHLTDGANLTIAGRTFANEGRQNQALNVARNIRFVGDFTNHITFSGQNIQGLSFYECEFENFAKGIILASNVYSLTFDVCGFNQNDICFYAPANLENLGERITFTNSVFANSNVGFESHLAATSDFYFISVSFDYCATHIVSNVASRLFFIGCHVEHNAIAEPFVNSDSHGELTFIGCSIGFTSGDSNPESYISNAGVVNFIGCNFGSMNTTYIVSGGFCKVNNCFRQSPTALPTGVNKLQKIDMSGITIINGTMSVSGDDIVCTPSSNGDMTIVFEVMPTNKFFFLNGRIIASDATKTIGGRVCNGCVQNGNVIYNTSIASGNLSEDVKLGNAVISSSLSNRNISDNRGLLYYLNCKSYTTGDTLTIKHFDFC